MSALYLTQLLVYFGLLFALAVPLGGFLARVFSGRNTATARVGGPIESAVLRAAGVDPTEEHDWKQYATAVLAFSLLTQLVTYLVLRLQGALPANPSGVGGVAPWLAFNTAVSFVANTNWQSYAGESTVSYLAQAVALTSQNFFSAATGLCVSVALVRGLTGTRGKGLGNFWVDLVRAHLYVLVPLAVVVAIVLASQGVVQTWEGAISWTTLDGQEQHLLRGPVASQEAIKMLGTNGGGFFNANSAHPWENPTPLSNVCEMLSIFLLPAALVMMLGELTGNRRHGHAVLGAMTVLALAGALAIGASEHHGNPALARLGVDQVASAVQAGGNMEGKEARFGIDASSLFAEVTTAASCGAVNAMHDSFTPLGGLVPMLNIQLGEIVFGGVGAGLYGMLVYVVLTVFLAGLMVGRTPEYLGKKLDSRAIRFAALYVLIPAFAILLGAAVGLSTEVGRAGILNTGAGNAAASWSPHAHGLSEVLYAYSSAVGNNGSAFGGLTAYSADHPVFYSLTLALAMFVGRFPLIIAVLALGGHLAGQRVSPPGPGTFPVDTPLFGALLVFVILIVGALTFFPALALGPVVEHLQLR